MIKENFRLVKFEVRPTDGFGSLAFFEAKKDIPFEIKRIYYVFNVPQNVQRGGHAHKQLKQILFCPYGSVEIILDDAIEKENIVLDDPSFGLIIEPGLWRDIIWHIDNSVLCVAASEYYDEKDYIRDYSEFVLFKQMTDRRQTD